MIEIDYFTNLDEELLETAKKELNEDPETRQNCIDTIRKWIIEHDDFFGRTDEGFILSFLRNCKFDLERTKKRITKYYVARKSYADWNLRTDVELDAATDIAGVSGAIAMNFAGGCPQNIVFIRPGTYNHDKYKFDYVPICCAIGVEYLLRDVRTQINGVHAVLDCKGLRVEQVFKVAPWQIFRFMYCAQNITPCRVKGIHVLHLPSVLNKFVSFGSRLLKKKLRKRLFFYGSDMKAFHENLKPEWLPEEYGGTCGPYRKFLDEDLEKFALMRDYYKEDAKYGMVEK